MAEQDPKREHVDQFILSDIDSVSHLEALFLLWRHRPDAWSVESMSQALYVSPDVTLRILRDLVDRDLIAVQADESQKFFYNSVPTKDKLVAASNELYRKELVRISRLIHSKPPRSLRDFARAFRFKDGE